MIGVVAALGATLGDLFLLATSNATRPGFEWLGPPSERLLLVGTYLGVLLIPFYGLGYADVAARIGPPYRRWITALGVAGGVLGGTTHGLTGLVIHVEQGGIDPVTLLGRHGAYLLPLWAMIGVVSITGSALYAIAVAGGRSALPRWTAVANPVVLLVVLAGLGSTSAVGRAFLVPAAPNVAHIVFFAVVATWGRGTTTAGPLSDQGEMARSRIR
jgi:hypothetical protein